MLLLAAAAAQPPAPLSPLIVDQNRADRLQPSTAPQSNRAPAATVSNENLTQVDATGAGVTIKGVGFSGARVPAVVAEAARVFLGQPASRENLTRLAKAMSDAYAKSPVALYTVVIPDQDLSNGQVRVVVAEGFVERVEFPKGSTRMMRAYAARIAAEKPLTRRMLQRYLSLMRDVPDATIDAQLLRGARPGGVVLSITQKRKWGDIAFGYSSQPVAQLGHGQLSAQAHVSSLLRDGDRTDLTGLASPDLKRFRYIAASHSTPIGSDGLTASVSAGYLVTHPRGLSADGTAKTAALSLAYPIIRGYTRNLAASLSVDGIDSDAVLLGTVLSSDHTRAARVALGYSSVKPRTTLTIGATVSRGLGILDARGTSGLTDIVFDKVNARATLDQAVGKKVVVRLRGSAQYSADRLAGAERFAVGGGEFGRAFPQAILSGDRGWGASAEVALRPKLSSRFTGTEIYVFADRADVHLVRRETFLPGSFDLASAGGGLRVSYTPRASISVEAARAINQPYAGYRERWRINLGWRLSLAHS